MNKKTPARQWAVWTGVGGGGVTTNNFTKKEFVVATDVHMSAFGTLAIALILFLLLPPRLLIRVRT